MPLILLVVIAGCFVGASFAYLQAYFARHDPEAGSALEVGAWFVGSGTIIVWLVIDPTGVLAPSLALATALAYLLTQELCERRSAAASRPPEHASKHASKHASEVPEGVAVQTSTPTGTPISPRSVSTS
jgi:hypothetical protein